MTTTTLLEEITAKGVSAVSSELTDSEAISMTEQYGAHNYKPLPVNLVRGDGCRVWDGAGKEYIDCIGAYSAVAHGHLNPAIVSAIVEQLHRMAVPSRAFYAPEVALFMKGLAEYAGLDMVCPMNTGAEAVETCIKLARKWAYTVKGVEQDKAEIIVGEGNFHGRTTTIVGFSTEPGYKDGFGPFTPGFKVVPFGSLAAIEEAIHPNTAAVLLEPIQAEGGVIVPEEGFMAGLREICDRNRVLLIWDEVQTGFCRTGKRFAWQWETARPDLMSVGKPLGGGVLPVSAAVGTREVVEVFVPGDHGSTFGGNPLGAAVALTAMAEMEREGLSDRAQHMGGRLAEGLASLGSDRIKEVRWRGLLFGIEVADGLDTKALSKAFLENAILTKETRQRTFRLTPPLIIDEPTVDEIVERVGRSLASV
ncbi:MAG: ornithine--oxo-acid transaminase [Fimbriimonadaceae bacterium]|nr:ornithine--oxo-acid transaminase [Fimbriimonadaceae bacterium]